MRVQTQVRRPPPSLVRAWRPAMERLVRTWNTIGAQVPDLEITSWYRSPAYNAATAGAAAFSQHTIGCAMDAKSSRIGKARLLTLVSSVAARNGCTALGSEGTAVHVQALPNGTVRAFAQRQPAAYYQPS